MTSNTSPPKQQYPNALEEGAQESASPVEANSDLPNGADTLSPPSQSPPAQPSPAQSPPSQSPQSQPSQPPPPAQSPPSQASPSHDGMLQTTRARVSIELQVGQVMLPLQDLKNLAVGYTFAQGDFTLPKATAHIDGKAFATGEFILIGTQVGFRITELL